MSQNQTSALGHLEGIIKRYRYHRQFIYCDSSESATMASTLAADIQYIGVVDGIPAYQDMDHFFVSMSLTLELKSAAAKLGELQGELYETYLNLQQKDQKKLYMDRVATAEGFLEGIFSNMLYFDLQIADKIIDQKIIFDEKIKEAEAAREHIVAIESQEYYDSFVEGFIVPCQKVEAARRTRDIVFYFESARKMLFDFCCKVYADDMRELENEGIPGDDTANEATGPTTNALNRKNKFSEAPFEDVEKFFYQLVENMDDTSYLTKGQFDQFIHRAFEGEPFADKISLSAIKGRMVKREIVGLFHLFFQANVTHRQGIGKYDPNANTDKYIRLLTDHFDNWTFGEVKGNFRRGGTWENFPSGR